MLQRPVGLVEDERPGLRQPAQDLAHEERVAVGLGGDLCGQLERRPASSSWPATAVMICATSSAPRPCRAMRCTPCDARAGRRARRSAGGPCRGPSRGRSRSPAAPPARRVRTHVLQAAPATARRPSAGRRARRTAAPLSATSPKQARDGLEQQVALGLGVGGLGLGQVLDAPAEVAREAAKLAPVTLDVTLRATPAGRARRAASRPRSTAHTAPRALQSRRPSRPRSPRRGRGGRRSSPAASCRSPARRESSTTWRCPDAGERHRFLERRALLDAAHVGDGRHRAQAPPAAASGSSPPVSSRERRPGDRERLHRLGKALQLELAGGGELDPLTAPGERLGQPPR